jgi:hypothetical protein
MGKGSAALPSWEETHAPIKRLRGVQNQSYEDENNLLFLPGMELTFLGRPHSSLFTIPVCRFTIDKCLQSESTKCIFNSSYAWDSDLTAP